MININNGSHYNTKGLYNGYKKITVREKLMIGMLPLLAK